MAKKNKGKIAAPEELRVNREQKRHLMERISTVERKVKYPEDVDDSEPKEVQRARKIVDDYEKAEQKKRDKIRARVDDAVDEAREVVLFGTREEALEAVKKFEEQFKD